MYNKIKNGSKVIALFLDLAKAFNIINHKKLQQLLPSFEISNLSLKWFHSYLESKKKRVNNKQRDK